MAGPVQPSSGITIDSSVVGWLITAAGAFILFLLGLVAKDFKEKVRKIDRICIELERFKTLSEQKHGEIHKNLAELAGDIEVVRQMVEDLRP